MTQTHLFMALVAFIAAMINAAAGGGSFLSFPALVGLGMPPIIANATNNFAMWMGNVTTVGGSYRDLDIERSTLHKYLIVSCIGSVVGAIALLHAGNAGFSALVPFLLLGATLLYIFGPFMTARASFLQVAHPESPFALSAQFLICVYGGFFGAAQGILTLALLNMLGMHDVRKAAALKNLLILMSNGVACVPYVLARIIDWPTAIIMGAGAFAGGWIGSHIVRRLPPAVMRGIVIAIGCVMTMLLFWKYTFKHA